MTLCVLYIINIPENPMFPAKLLEVVEFLNSISIAVSESHEDGRVNSIDDEDTIIDLLIEKYGEENIIKPPPR